MRTTSHFVAALLALACIVAARPAEAYDLTGHWEGKWSCIGTTNGVKTKTARATSTLIVTSLTGDKLAAYLDLQRGFLGIAIPDAAKPEKGEAALVACGTDEDPSNAGQTEVGRWKVATKGAKGVLSGTSVRSNGAGDVQTCKYKYKRVDTVDDDLKFLCTT